MMKQRRIIPAFLLLSLILVAIPVMGANDYSEQKIVKGSSLSPINPEFASFLNQARESRLDFDPDTTVALGLVPTPVDLSFSRGTRIEDFRTSSTADKYSGLVSAFSDSYFGEVTPKLSSSFDLRTQGKVSSVKNQGQCGSCWAFSSLASLESALLPSEKWDFSEDNLRNSHGYDLSSCQGGNSMMATAYLARWSGVVTESDDPYSTSSGKATSSTYPNSEAVKHVQEVLYIPGRGSALDNDNIKRTLSEKGALYSTIRWEESAYAASTASYYYSGTSQANHAITIVGWDDTYERSRFSKQPPGDGAFIVKNSWGSNWGDNGYFYVSYYDTVIGRDNAFYSAEGSGNYYHIYQYDPLGWVVSYGDNSDTAYFANVFTAQSVEDVSAVSFYTATTNSKYQLSVYTGVGQEPVSGSLVCSRSGTIGVPGYHTITLSTPVRLQKNERFSIVVKLTTPGYNFPVAVEYPYNGFSSGARSSNGQSYVSSTGTLWTDLSSVYPNSNVCLKAFTIQVSGSPTPTPTPSSIVTPIPTSTPDQSQSDTRSPTVSITSPRSFSSVSPGSSIQVIWSAKDNVGVTSVGISYSKDKGKTWVTTAGNLAKSGTYTLTVPSDVSGTLMVRVTAWDSEGNEGSLTRSCIVRSTTKTSNALLKSGTSVSQPSRNSDVSDSFRFSTVSPNYPAKHPVVSISSPHSYCHINTGEIVEVEWSSSDDKAIAGVDVSYSTDAGITWMTAARNLKGSGTLPLTVPSDVSGTFMIRVTAWDSAGNEGSATRSCIVRSSVLSTPAVQVRTTIIPVSIPTIIGVDRSSHIEEFLSR